MWPQISTNALKGKQRVREPEGNKNESWGGGRVGQEVTFQRGPRTEQETVW